MLAKLIESINIRLERMNSYLEIGMKAMAREEAYEAWTLYIFYDNILGCDKYIFEYKDRGTMYALSEQMMEINRKWGGKQV